MSARHDPAQSLRLSVLLMRIWAAVSPALGAVAVLPLTFALLRGRTKFSFPGHVLYFAACGLVFIAPAALYLTLSFYVERRRYWAIMTAIVVAAVHGLFALIGLIALSLLLPKVGSYLLVPGAGAVLFIVACSHMIWCLIHSFAALDLPTAQPRGFDLSPAENRSS